MLCRLWQPGTGHNLNVIIHQITISWDEIQKQLFASWEKALEEEWQESAAVAQEISTDATYSTFIQLNGKKRKREKEVGSCLEWIDRRLSNHILPLAVPKYIKFHPSHKRRMSYLIVSPLDAYEHESMREINKINHHARLFRFRASRRSSTLARGIKYLLSLDWIRRQANSCRIVPPLPPQPSGWRSVEEMFWDAMQI